MAAAVVMSDNEMMGDLLGRNIAVQIECDPDSMPSFTIRAYSRLSHNAIAVVHGHRFSETLALLHEALLGE